eukprot:TRINITY_DN2192_c0_g1_i5.p1 TRINITY_DN2192_c0_g1~~TRINITY_DN2192_c0_g1_i5.p1  ORF type:complete len:286 (+),score=61.94 TRINITY_DN2192_c0_g1_i5:38-895(+)
MGFGGKEGKGGFGVPAYPGFGFPWGQMPGSWDQGGSWAKGGGGKSRRPPKNTVPADFVLDPEKRYVGTVAVYYKYQGYGFITLDETGMVPEDKVFVHWKALESADRFPCLNKDMKVQFKLAKAEKNGAMTLKATDVRLPDGALIALQDAIDADKKQFVGGQSLRYTGTMKFFIPKRGFGYIKIDDGFQYGDEAVPREIRAEFSELNAGGANPKSMKDTPVEFGIWKTPKGAYKAYNVTLPGGLSLPAEEDDAEGGSGLCDADPVVTTSLAAVGMVPPSAPMPPLA